jgi:hypothetical protein
LDSFRTSSHQLHLARRHLGVHGTLAAQTHGADRRDDILRADMLRLGMPLPRQVLVQHHLCDTRAIAQVEKDQVSVIAPAIDPPHQNDLFRRVRRAKLATGVGALQCA